LGPPFCYPSGNGDPSFMPALDIPKADCAFETESPDKREEDKIIARTLCLPARHRWLSLGKLERHRIFAEQRPGHSIEQEFVQSEMATGAGHDHPRPAADCGRLPVAS